MSIADAGAVGRCPGCGARTWHEIDPSDRSFELFRCATCASEAIRLDRPEPAQLYERYYASEAARRASGPFDAVWSALRRQKAARILRVAPGRARVLDVGCERGELLNVLRARGASVAGTQISESAAAYARRHFGLDVFVGELSAAPYAPGSFDLVLMINVLEHLPDPERYVADVARLLRVGGIFWLELPNPRSLTARLTTKRWLHADPDHHFWSFSERGLRGLLGRHSFVVEEVNQWSWEHGPIGCVQSWLNLLPGPRNVLFDAIVGAPGPRSLVLIAHAILGALLLLPGLAVSALESTLGDGQVMRVRARLQAGGDSASSTSMTGMSSRTG